MINLRKIRKLNSELGTVNSHLALYAFISDQVFLTTSGAVGVVLELNGPDGEVMELEQQAAVVERFRSGSKALPPGTELYFYFQKTNRPNILAAPITGNEVADGALSSRCAFLEAQRDDLYVIKIYLVIIYQTEETVANMASKLARFARHPISNLHQWFSHSRTVKFIEVNISRDRTVLLHAVDILKTTMGDHIALNILHKSQAFDFLRTLLNPDPDIAHAARLQHDEYLDYFLADSPIEAHRNHLIVGDHFLSILSLKDLPPATTPNMLRRLSELPGEFTAVLWSRPQSRAAMRREMKFSRSHFHMTKTALFSGVIGSRPPQPGDELVSTTAVRLVDELGEAQAAMEVSDVDFTLTSLSVLVWDRHQQGMQRAISQVLKIATHLNCTLVQERLNLLNAFFASIPGGSDRNFRRQYVSTANLADLAFLFSAASGDAWNHHLNRPPLALLQTRQGTLFNLNLHHGDVGHMLIQGQIGSGKSFVTNFLVSQAQAYTPYTFIADIGGSYQGITELFGGSYTKVTESDKAVQCNPFSLPPTPENQQFQISFVQLLIEAAGHKITNPETRELSRAIVALQSIDPSIRRLSTLARTLPKPLAEALSRWVDGGQFARWFDNSEDTISTTHFSCFDFQGMKRYPEVLEALLFYVLHRASSAIKDPANLTQLKIFVVDEAWRFFKNRTVLDYIIDALKTWRKHNAALILVTQSSEDLAENQQLLQTVVESAATQIYLSNPGMDQARYREVFHLTEAEARAIATLQPKRELLVKQNGAAKIVRLEVDHASYWLYTTTPADTALRREVFARLGFKEGLKYLASQPRAIDRKPSDNPPERIKE